MRCQDGSYYNDRDQLESWGRSGSATALIQKTLFEAFLHWVMGSFSTVVDLSRLIPDIQHGQVRLLITNLARVGNTKRRLLLEPRRGLVL